MTGGMLLVSYYVIPTSYYCLAPPHPTEIRRTRYRTLGMQTRVQACRVTLVVTRSELAKAEAIGQYHAFFQQPHPAGSGWMGEALSGGTHALEEAYLSVGILVDTV
jgi:hypothetical protein